MLGLMTLTFQFSWSHEAQGKRKAKSESGYVIPLTIVAGTQSL
jgi:hypothetical protein